MREDRGKTVLRLDAAPDRHVEAEIGEAVGRVVRVALRAELAAKGSEGEVEDLRDRLLEARREASVADHRASRLRSLLDRERKLHDEARQTIRDLCDVTPHPDRRTNIYKALAEARDVARRLYGGARQVLIELEELDREDGPDGEEVPW